MDLEFDSVEELYLRLLPALRSKQRELVLLHYPYLKEQDIFEYLKATKWKEARGLTLAEMVNDILHVDVKMVDQAVKNRLMKRPFQEEIEMI